MAQKIEAQRRVIHQRGCRLLAEAVAIVKLFHRIQYAGLLRRIVPTCHQNLFDQALQFLMENAAQGIKPRVERDIGSYVVTAGHIIGLTH
jgi:hypothetical protein